MNTSVRFVAVTMLPALALLAAGLVPGMPAGLAVGAAFALPLLGVGAVAVLIGLGSLRDPLQGGFSRAVAGAGVGFAVRLAGAVGAALTLGHDAVARAALATLAGCLFVGVMSETALLMRALQRAGALQAAAVDAEGSGHG
jgi:hypothetical protein